LKYKIFGSFADLQIENNYYTFESNKEKGNKGIGFVSLYFGPYV